MTHLSRADLLDAIEARATLAAAHAHHLETCAACRAQADTLRSVLSRASEDQVPEPSPLFWDHFAARVSAAVHNETIAGAPRFAHLHRASARWVLVAAAVVLAIVTVVWRATLHAPSPPGPAAAPSLAAKTPPAPAPAAVPADDVNADVHWAVVRAAAEGLGWDDVQAAGIAAPSGAAEELAMELSDAERTELARLLNQELKRNGV